MTFGPFKSKQLAMKFIRRARLDHPASRWAIHLNGLFRYVVRYDGSRPE